MITRMLTSMVISQERGEVRHRLRTVVESGQRVRGWTLAQSRPGDGSPRRAARWAASGGGATLGMGQRHGHQGAVAGFQGHDRRERCP
jgi:hypothetical protein